MQNLNIFNTIDLFQTFYITKYENSDRIKLLVP